MSRVGHRAGRILEVDRAGPTMSLVDPATGEASKVFLLVACPPLGRLSHVEPTLDMRGDTWLRCHVHAFAHMGGSTPRMVPDDLRTGAGARPREGEVEPSEAHREMAAHHGSAVMPARVAAPRDKPSAESEAWQAALEIIAALRDEAFADFNRLKRAVAERLGEHDSRPFPKREGTRREAFEEQERPLPRPPPAVPHEACEWAYGRRVRRSCHVAHRRSCCSASHLAVGRTVDLRATDATAGVFLAGERLATHPPFPSFARNRCPTHAGDLPEGRSYPDWDAGRIRRRADRAGPSRREAVGRIFRRVDYEGRGLDAALAALGPERRHARPRLGRACAMALASGPPPPRHRRLKPVLETNQGLVPGTLADGGGPGEDEAGHVRGADLCGEAQGDGPLGGDEAQAARHGRRRPAGRPRGPGRGHAHGHDLRRAGADGRRRGPLGLRRAQGPKPHQARQPEVPGGRRPPHRLLGGARPGPAADHRARRLRLRRARPERGAAGPTGTGKTCLARAIARAACQRRMRACHVRCPDLEGHWREARERPGGERKVTRRYAAFQVLVLDEWPLDRPDELFRGFLPGLVGARCGTASTVFCAQFRQKDWHARLGGGARADAIMDRIVHGAARVGMGEMNMRRKLEGDSS